MILILDSIIVFASMFVSHILSAGVLNTFGHLPVVFATLGCYMVPFWITFRIFHTYAGVLRYSTFSDVVRVVEAVFVSCVFLGIIDDAMLYYGLNYEHDFPLYIRNREMIFSFFFAVFLMSLLRLAVKYLYDATVAGNTSVPVFIYGVKEGGISIANSIKNQHPSKFTLCGFVSDEDEVNNRQLLGVRVYPNDDNIVDAMVQKGANALLISPQKSESLRENEKMINALVDANIRIYMLPHAVEIHRPEDINYTQLKKVEIEDLLPRDEISVDMEAVENLLVGKNIVITGAAGSIGSEIVRQVCQFQPAGLLLIDIAETPQHDLELMLHKDFPNVKAEVVVGSICNRSRMEELFLHFKPDYVFHAAAYKHVPMMEQNPGESVNNNVVGTRIMADLSVKYGVKKFVMVSTDKAVNPTNVMGCSKRICEIYVQSLDKAIKEKKIEGVTQFVTTRFGNVLGSNGSVIPLFRKQIEEGGPVTVTDPNIIRFFMLIPEACKLVLEAGTKGRGGEIFVFDMGKPVRIADLAQRMIKLSGAENVTIKYTGLREGEKLYEEVLNDEEATKPTFHPKIKIASVREYDYQMICEQLEILSRLGSSYDNMAIVKQMKMMVPEYKSQNSIYEAVDRELEREV